MNVHICSFSSAIGKLQTRKWQTKEGQDRYTTEIIVNEMQMLGSKRDDLQSGGQASTKPATSTQKYDSNPPGRPGGAPAKGSNFDNFDDDIPF